MNVEVIDPKSAMRILRAHQARVGEPHNRIHKESMVDTVARMRALEGICGSCTNLVLEKTRDYVGKPAVQLRCLAKYSPLELYRNTKLGQEANCPGLECD